MAAAGNEWINGYLEAILDAGSRLRGQRQGYGGGAGAAPPPLTTAALPKLLAEAGGHQAAAAYSPTRYFVEEVVSRFDDRDLHKTWTKVRVRCVRRRWRWRRADRPPPVDRCPRSSSHESHDEQLAVMDSWLLLNSGCGDAQQPGAEQPAGEPVLEDLARRKEEEAGAYYYVYCLSRSEIGTSLWTWRLLCFLKTSSLQVLLRLRFSSIQSKTHKDDRRHRFRS